MHPLQTTSKARRVAAAASGNMRHSAVVCAEVVVRASKGHQIDKGFFAELVLHLPPCGTNHLVCAIKKFPPSHALYCNALHVNPLITSSGLAGDDLFQSALVAYVRDAPANKLGPAVRSIHPGCMTRALAERLVKSNFGCLAHFTKQHADKAGANMGASMYTVVDLASIREDRALASLSSQQALLEDAWAEPTFADDVLTARQWPPEGDRAEAADAAFEAAHKSHVLKRCDIGANVSQKIAPFAAKHVSRLTLRLAMTHGTNASVRAVGSRALRQNNYEAALLRLLLHTETRHMDTPAFNELRCCMAGSQSIDGPAGLAIKLYGTLIAKKRCRFAVTTNTRRFARQHRWRMGVEHALSVLRYLALPVFVRTPSALPYVRMHPVAASMPPTTCAFLRTFMGCVRRVGGNCDVANLILKCVLWTETHPRAHEACHETLHQTFRYI